MFHNLIKPRDLTKYTLMRGVTDFGNLSQYNLYETGYPFLAIVSKPKLLTAMSESDSEGVGKLIENYFHILEYEFRGLDGIEDITSEGQELTNGISQLSIITKVNQQSASSFSMRYFEKAGSVITRTHEIFLRGIKDPRTQIKHYNGMLANGKIKSTGYENEVFSFLYFVTDNSCREIEKAYLIISAQPTKAETSIYNVEKGDIQFKEVSVEFNGFPITGDEIDKRAKGLLDWMNNSDNKNKMIVDSMNFMYTGISDIGGMQGMTADFLAKKDPRNTNGVPRADA